MSSITPRIFPAPPANSTEPPQSKDLETIVSRLDEQLHELKAFLQDKTKDSCSKNEPESQGSMSCLRDTGDSAADTGNPLASPLLTHNWVKFAVTPMEAEAIIERVGKFEQDAVDRLEQDEKVKDRLAKVEQQNRRLTILGSLCGLLMLVFFSVSMYLWNQTTRPLQATLDKTSTQPARKVAPPGEASAKPPAPATREAPQPPAPSLAQEALPKPANAGSPVTTSIPQEPVTPSIKYVGSITSNKYHQPTCKWAKTIIPKKIRGFTSVEEAKKEGYLPCPTCRPPLTDTHD